MTHEPTVRTNACETAYFATHEEHITWEHYLL
jgi:hypothetical protein